MSQPKILAAAIGPPLKSAGFKKKADTWYLENNETILVVNLQKSSYGPQYYINIAIWLKALGDVEYPKEYLCHIRLRWENLVPITPKCLERLLDLEDTSISDEQRVAKITEFIEKYILPFFSRVTSLAGIRSIYHTDSWPKGCGVRGAAQKLFE